MMDEWAQALAGRADRDREEIMKLLVDALSERDEHFKRMRTSLLFEEQKRKLEQLDGQLAEKSDRFEGIGLQQQSSLDHPEEDIEKFDALRKNQ